MPIKKRKNKQGFIKQIAITLSKKLVEAIKNNPILFLILLLAFCVRIIGTNPGFPYNGDEGTSYGRAVTMLYNWLRPDFFDYPAGMAFFHLVIYLVFFIPLSVARLILLEPQAVIDLLKQIDNPIYFSQKTKELIFGPHLIYAMYWSRYIAAFVGTGAVLLTYLVGKKAFGKSAGLFAAFFVAVNYRHVLGSHFGLPDVHHSFFGMLSLFAAMWVYQKATLKRYILTGIVAGVYFSLKYQIFGFLTLVTAHVLTAFKKRSFFYLFHPNIILAGISLIIVFIILNPYYLFNIPEAITMHKQDYGRYGFGILGFKPYHYFYLYNFGIGQLPSVAIICGLLLALIFRFTKVLLILSFALPYLFVLTIYSNGGIFPRNFTTVIPFLLLFAGYFFGVIFNLLSKRFGKVGVIATLILFFFVIVTPLKNSVMIAYSFALPWNSVKHEEWIREKLPKNITVRTYPLGAAYKQEALRELNTDRKVVDWRYDVGLNTVAGFQNEDTDFAILNTHTLQNVTYWWRQALPPHVLWSYNKVPFDFIENGFFGLTMREFRQYTVFESYKSWQAHEEPGYVVFKLPKRPKEIGEKVAFFTFDKNDINWKILGNYDMQPPKIYWDKKEGHSQPGSITFIPGQTATSHAVFPPISINGGKWHAVKGFIKSPESNDVENEYGSYLRIEFYKDKSEKTLSEKSLAVAISQRSKPDAHWTTVFAGIKAPKEAKYMTISLQSRRTSGIIYFDDIEVFETDKIPEEHHKEVPYIKSTIPLESLYWDSFL